MATGAPTAKAYAAINLVRNRAGLPNLTPGLSQLAFRDSVVYERAYEFAGEFGMRWFDIVRLQLLPQVIAARNNETYIDVDGKTKNKENPISAAARADPSTRYLAPIPQTEMNQNPWQQNPGY
jgi:starch-binding outer membrane protein, SusD/RagB family